MVSEKGQEAKNIGVDEALKKAKSKNTSQKRDLRNDILTYEKPPNTAWTLDSLILLIISVLLFLLPAAN